MAPGGQGAQSRGARAGARWTREGLRQRARWPPCSWGSSSWTWRAGVQCAPAAAAASGAALLSALAEPDRDPNLSRGCGSGGGGGGSDIPGSRLPTTPPPPPHSPSATQPQPPAAAAAAANGRFGVGPCKRASRPWGGVRTRPPLGAWVGEPLPGGRILVAASGSGSGCGVVGLGEGAPGILSLLCALCATQPRAAPCPVTSPSPYWNTSGPRTRGML